MKVVPNQLLSPPIIVPTIVTTDDPTFVLYVTSPYLLSHEHGLGAIEVVDIPFRYFLARRCLAHSMEQALLEWFETTAPWKLVETDFYEQYEFSMLHAPLPEPLIPLTQSPNLSFLSRSMGALFDLIFSDRISVLAHKLVPGQRIAIHNDYLGGHETHRLTIQLNRGLRDRDGGLFILFNSADPNDIHRIIRPVAGSGLGFEIGENSNHAVSRLHHGERYTLVFSFYARPADDTPKRCR